MTKFSLQLSTFFRPVAWKSTGSAQLTQVRALIWLLGGAFLLLFPQSLSAAVPASPPIPPAKFTLAWPCAKHKILAPFQQPEHFYSAGHRGISILCLSGDTIRAAAEGEVFFSGMVAGTPTISIEHKSGFRTTYLPVESSHQKGEKVARGEIIGKLKSENSALHFGVKIDKRNYLNPLLFLPVKIRLIE